MPETFTATIHQKTTVSEDTFILTLKAPSAFHFQAGQFIMLDFGRNEANEVVRRAYSVASSTSQLPLIDLAIRVSRENSKSLPFLQEFTSGTEVQFDGPYGLFKYESSARRKVFIAAGTGIAPIRAMIGAWQASKDHQPAILLYGASDLTHFLFHKEFEHLNQTVSNFTAHLVLNEESTHNFLRGYTTHHLHLLEAHPETDDIYVCGPPAMVADIETELVKQGFDPRTIKKERF